MAKTKITEIIEDGLKIRFDNIKLLKSIKPKSTSKSITVKLNTNGKA